MPIVQISLNVNLVEQEKQNLHLSIARLVSEVLEKPLHDVMVSLTMADFAMGGTFEPAAFMDLRCLSGLQGEDVPRRLCEGMLSILRRYVSIDPARVYINFFEVHPECAWRFKDGVAVCPKSSTNAR
ncbi:MAG: hypothetical protein JXA21_01140 [Anaerolineae bacterium]|nr:hypothetical protein [Anaerolineae bacterium]